MSTRRPSSTESSTALMEAVPKSIPKKCGFPKPNTMCLYLFDSAFSITHFHGYQKSWQQKRRGVDHRRSRTTWLTIAPKKNRMDVLNLRVCLKRISAKN